MVRASFTDSNRGVQSFLMLTNLTLIKEMFSNWWVQLRSSSKIEGCNCTPCTPLTEALLCDVILQPVDLYRVGHMFWVAFQVTFLRKCIVTKLTIEWFLSFMNWNNTGPPLEGCKGCNCTFRFLRKTLIAPLNFGNGPYITNRFG